MVAQDDVSPKQNMVSTEILMVLEQKTNETHMDDSLGGTKHVHVFESLDSDKDNPLEISECSLALDPVGTNLVVW